MFTDENTEGFTKEQLDKMNAEVEELLTLHGLTKARREEIPSTYQEYLQWAEEKVLKKYGGA